MGVKGKWDQGKPVVVRGPRPTGLGTGYGDAEEQGINRTPTRNPIPKIGNVIKRISGEAAAHEKIESLKPEIERKKLINAGKRYSKRTGL